MGFGYNFFPNPPFGVRMLFPPNEEENGRRERGLMGIYPFALSFLLFVVVVVFLLFIFYVLRI